ncbi:alpha/beta hydrolase [Helicobacter sp. MIT 99-5507]|uniref:alpha/beta hydrolase n=1 Tax=Helicobacter sp. MIT 99-5507 TaxID=152489 RepID=UPI000E1E7DA7|nr:alpha/beta hydrolase-fold protein [Helicobacter sp. MIT 99-5507]RDU58155.1 IroE protein [Helicobacter sp. MIT 99-5507]
MKKILIYILIFSSVLLAKPSQNIESISKEAKEIYKIENFRIENNQGRFYNIFIATPKNDTKEIFYTLDGNAFFPMLLNRIATNKLDLLPIIVGIGHDSELAFDRQLRIFDYLPKIEDEEFSGGGGDEIFLEFINTKLKPFIHEKVGIPEKELLFGHSFGGIFVLHTILKSKYSFSHYVCASPSLWWGQGEIIKQDLESMQNNNTPLNILFTLGSLEKTATHKTTKPQKITLQEVISNLKKSNSNNSIKYVEFANQTHGSSLPMALIQALKWLYEID